jgi:hypothetical protein
MVGLPFRRSIRGKIAHLEASDVPTDPLSVDNRPVPRPIVAHRTFD